MIRPAFLLALALGVSVRGADMGEAKNLAAYLATLPAAQLPALTEHVLILPEGDASRRRHAHTQCAVKARKAGRLPLREDVEPRPPGLFARLFGRQRRGTRNLRRPDDRP